MVAQRAGVAVLVASYSVLVSADGGPLSPQHQADLRYLIIGVLEQYAEGQPSELHRLLNGVQSSETFVNTLGAVSPGWIRDGAGVERVRRSRTVAVVILETYDHAAATRGWNPGDLEMALEWATDHLRSMPRSEFERLWYLSAVALASAAKRFDVLTGGSRGSRFGRGFSLLDGAESRYPEEPRFRLARVVAGKPARTVANRPGISPTMLAGPPRLSGGAAVRDVTATLRRFDDLAGHGAIGAEARLRAGMIRFHLGQLEAALDDARHAAGDEEPFVSYLGHLLAGHALVHLGRDAEAIQAYERAVAIDPRARSGVVALASRLVAAERHDDAYALVERYFEADVAVDPWLQYGWGDYRLWPDYLLRLRALIPS